MKNQGQIKQYNTLKTKNIESVQHKTATKQKNINNDDKEQRTTKQKRKM